MQCCQYQSNRQLNVYLFLGHCDYGARVKYSIFLPDSKGCMLNISALQTSICPESLFNTPTKYLGRTGANYQQETAQCKRCFNMTWGRVTCITHLLPVLLHCKYQFSKKIQNFTQKKKKLPQVIHLQTYVFSIRAQRCKYIYIKDLLLQANVHILNHLTQLHNAQINCTCLSASYYFLLSFLVWQV